MDRRQLHKTIIKKFGSKRVSGNLPIGFSRKYNRNHLAELFGEIGYNKGAEIGVRRGRYSTILCKLNSNLELFCIDPWMAYTRGYGTKRQNRIYEEAVKRLSDYNTKIIRKTSMDALELFEDRQLDFVYIDGNHKFDYVMLDIIHWTKKVKTNGIIACHDYYPMQNGEVVAAIDAYTKSHRINPWYVTKELEPTAFWINP